MTVEMPLFFEYESLYRKQYIKDVIKDRMRFSLYEIQLDHRASDEVKASYEDYCKGRGQKPIYY